MYCNSTQSLFQPGSNYIVAVDHIVGMLEESSIIELFLLDLNCMLIFIAICSITKHKQINYFNTQLLWKQIFFFGGGGGDK